MSNVGYLIQTITCAHEHILSSYKVPNRTSIGCSWAGFRKLRSFREPPITSINVNYGIQSLLVFVISYFSWFAEQKSMLLKFRCFSNRLQNYKKYFISANYSLQFRLFCHYLHKKRQFVPFSRFVRSRLSGR